MEESLPNLSFHFFYRHFPLRVPHGDAQHRSCSVARQMKGQGLEIVKWAPVFSLNLFRRVWKTKKKKKKHLQGVENKKENAKYLHRCIIQVTLHAHSIRALCQTHAGSIKDQLQHTFALHKRGCFYIVQVRRSPHEKFEIWSKSRNVPESFANITVLDINNWISKSVTPFTASTHDKGRNAQLLCDFRNKRAPSTHQRQATWTNMMTNTQVYKLSAKVLFKGFTQLTVL